MDAYDIIKIKEAEKNDVITKDGITLFWGGWASQWYPSPFLVDNINFNCAEQYMMYAKAQFFGDTETAAKVLEAKWPKQQKELGRSVRNFTTAWDEPEGSRAAVLRGNMAKFSQNTDLLFLLFQTKDNLIGEASPYDMKWGIGCSSRKPYAWQPEHWTGTNWLGKVLMQTRTLLRDHAYYAVRPHPVVPCP